MITKIALSFPDFSSKEELIRQVNSSVSSLMEILYRQEDVESRQVPILQQKNGRWSLNGNVCIELEKPEILKSLSEESLLSCSLFSFYDEELSRNLKTDNLLEQGFCYLRSMDEGIVHVYYYMPLCSVIRESLSQSEVEKENAEIIRILFRAHRKGKMLEKFISCDQYGFFPLKLLKENPNIYLEAEDIVPIINAINKNIGQAIQEDRKESLKRLEENLKQSINMKVFSISIMDPIQSTFLSSIQDSEDINILEIISYDYLGLVSKLVLDYHQNIAEKDIVVIAKILSENLNSAIDRQDEESIKRLSEVLCSFLSFHQEKIYAWMRDGIEILHSEEELAAMEDDKSEGEYAYYPTWQYGDVGELQNPKEVMDYVVEIITIIVRNYEQLQREQVVNDIVMTFLNQLDVNGIVSVIQELIESYHISISTLTLFFLKAMQENNSEVITYEVIFNVYKCVSRLVSKEEAIVYLYQASLYEWAEEDRNNFFQQDEFNKLSNDLETKEKIALRNMNEDINRLINHRKDQNKKRFQRNITLGILFASLFTLAPFALLYYCIARISLWAQKKTTSYTLSVADYLKYKQYKKDVKNEQQERSGALLQEEGVESHVRKKTFMLVNSERSSHDKKHSVTKAMGDSAAILTKLNAKLLQEGVPVQTEKQLTEGDLDGQIQVIGAISDMKEFEKKVKQSKGILLQPQ